jgi:hypothetical protein
MLNIIVSFVIVFFGQGSLSFSSGIPGERLPKRMRTGYDIAVPTQRDYLNQYIQEVRPKLSQTLRDVVPSELILSSGFLAKEQDPLDIAGCYIRLGQHLRSCEVLDNRYYFASIAFLNAGGAYANLALTLRENSDDMDVKEIITNFLVSSAQCYYWAFCNEPNAVKRAAKRNLAIDYLTYAREDSNSLTQEKRLFWLSCVDRERAKLL